MNLTFALARPKGQEEYCLEVQMLQGGLLDWIKWSLSWCTARKKFQEGMPPLPLGLSLRKLSRRRARFPSLLMLKGEFPVYQQWETYNHQWCWAVAKHVSHFYACPNPGPRGNCLEGQMLQGGLQLVQNEPCQLVQKPGRGSRRGFPSGLWVCLSGSYPGDEWDFHPY